MKEKDNDLHPVDCSCILCEKLRKEEEFIEFLPYEPLPVDEEGNPYFPPSVGILHANYEVRQPGEKRLQFLDEDDDGPSGSQT